MHQQRPVLFHHRNSQHMHGFVHLVTSCQESLANANAPEREISSLRSVSTRRIVSILFLNGAILILTKLSMCLSSGVRLDVLLTINVNDYADSSCRHLLYSNLSRVLAAEVL